MYNLRPRKAKSSSQSAESSSSQKRSKVEKPDKKLDELPPEILVNIFKYLELSDMHHKVALVCKTFHEVTKSPELNRKASFFADSDPKAVNSFLKQRGQHLWSLELAKVKTTSRLLRTAAKVCSSLRCLRVSGDIDYRVLTDLSSGKTFPGLTSLHLQGQNFYDETMVLLLERRCDCLRSLVTRTHYIEDESLQDLELCTRLETLDVGHLSFDIMMGITAMSQLSNLVLGTNLFPSANNFVELFQVGAFPQLDSLNLNGYIKLTDEGFRAILRSAPNLAKLKLNSCDQLTGNFALELAQSGESFPDLRTFHLEQLSAIPNSTKFLNAITTIFPNLQFLNLRGGWNHVSDSRFIKAVRKSPGKTLMIVTWSKIFADGEMTMEELEERKAENTSWDYYEEDDQEIVQC